jgi:hypothetical protein
MNGYGLNGQGWISSGARIFLFTTIKVKKGKAVPVTGDGGP